MRDVASADAHGRVNLMGEHTDYHDGYVLPTIIPQRTVAHVERRSDRRVRAASAAMPLDALEYDLGCESPGRGWLDYVQGVTATLARRAVEIPGFNLRLESTIPLGAGVSSSAALEVSVLRSLRILAGFELDDVTLARVAQAVETEFVGAPVGIMDQMASSLGHAGEALFLDTRTLAVQRVPIPPDIEVVVIDSGIAHTHAGGQYAARRRESFEAAALLGVERLRDIDSHALGRIDALPPLLARRARHVVTENERVLAAVEALRAGNAQRLGVLFNESHASMRDDYDTSTPEIDLLVAIAEQHPDVFGARLTGGGFGGAVVAIARSHRALSAADGICRAYNRETGQHGVVLVPPTASPS